MSSITIRGCCIGAGRPKVILPIVASTVDGILSGAARLAAQKADCIEWRADWFSGALDPAALGQVLSGLRAALGEKLLLVTFRTKAEGGEAFGSAMTFANPGQASAPGQVALDVVNEVLESLRLS